MNKKNSMPIKPMLLVLVILLAIAYWMHHPSKNISKLINIISLQTENIKASNKKTPIAIPEENKSGSRETNASQTENNSGNNAAGGDQTNAPITTANPLPTNADVLRLVELQNQRHDDAYAILAEHQALAALVQQTAQASKNQTVTSQRIPAPSTDPAPADVIAKIKSNQVAVSR